MPNKTYDFPAIPEPTADPAALLQSVQALRQVVQTLTGQRPNTPSIVSQAAQTATQLQHLEEQYVENGQATAKIIDQVQASANGITAGGKLKFIATAGPEGYYASYKLVLSAGNAQTGFEVLAGLDGNKNPVSVINFTAEKFQLYDPTLNNGQPKGPTQVFSYFQGVFRFNVPVEVLGEQLEISGVTNSDLTIANDEHAVSVACVLTTRPYAQVDIYGQFDGQPTNGFPTGEAGVKQLRLTRTDKDGNVVNLRDIKVQFYVVRSNDGVNSYYFTQTNMIYRDMPPIGQNTYSLFMINGTSQGPLSLSVIERHR